MQKECFPILLPTNREAVKGDIVLNTPNNFLSIMSEREKHSNWDIIKIEGSTFKEWDRAMPAQYLYICSKEEIKEGDWYWHVKDNEIRKSEFNWTKAGATDDEPLKAYKVIATTDSYLNECHCKSCEGVNNKIHKGIPAIPQSFIQYYIEQYNKGNKLEKCNVEYIQGWGGGGHTIRQSITVLKLNGNEIIISEGNLKQNKSISDCEEKLYTEAHVLFIMNNMYRFKGGVPWQLENLNNEWLKQNL